MINGVRYLTLFYNTYFSGSRKEALIAKMQTNESTYLSEPELSPEEKKVLDTFNSSFKIDEYTDEIAQLLNDHPDLRDTMDKLGKLSTLPSKERERERERRV